MARHRRSPEEHKKTWNRAGFVLVAVLLIAILVALPFALVSIAQDIARQATDTHQLAFPAGLDAPAYTLHLELTGFNDAEGTVTARVTGVNACEPTCADTIRLYLISVLKSVTQTAPVAETVTFAPGVPFFTQTVRLPVAGDPIRYPFDSYDRKALYESAGRSWTPDELCCAHQGANMVSSAARTAVAAVLLIRPSRVTSRPLSTVRIWSSTIWPALRWNVTGTRVGYGRPLVVMGATMTVWMCRFISSGEMITQGRVFWISCPSLGSSRTRYTSKRETTIPTPSCPTPSHAATPDPADGRHRALPCAGRRHPNRSVPAVPAG